MLIVLATFSALGCSENGQKWFLFASYVLLVSLGFAFVLDFFAGTGLLEHV
jgi:hypothetical protein